MKFLTTFFICPFMMTISIGSAQSQTLISSDSIPDDSSAFSIIAFPLIVMASVMKNPFAVSTIELPDIEILAEPTIEPLLNSAPGIWMQTGALNTNRISIRGVGYREPFATTGIKIYLDDIPLTNGVGESSIEDIHPNILSGIAIWRGPASALWGSGLGGMIHLKSRVAEEDTWQTKFQVGSFDRLQFDQHVNVQFGKNNQWGTALHYQYLNDGGYRDNNHYRKNAFTWLQQWQGQKGLTVNTLVHAIDLKAFIPSSLNLYDYEINPSAAAPSWAAVNGNEDYTKWITGINLMYAPEKKWVYRGSFFGTFFNSTEVRPFNVLVEDDSSLGMRHRFTYKLSDQGYITGGFEYFHENYNFSTFETLDGGEAGDRLTFNKESRSYINAFVQSEWTLGQKWVLFGGLNVAASRLAEFSQIVLQIPVDLFPTIGINYAFRPNVSIAGSWSRGYSALSLEDVLDANGYVNHDIVPESGWSREISFKAGDSKTSFVKLSLFSMNIENTVITKRIQDDIFIKLNGGSSLHEGIELEYKWTFSSAMISLEGAYTLGHYTFDDFVEAGVDYGGNQLPGAPLHHTYSRLSLLPTENWNFHIDHQWISEVYLNDANTVTGKGYQLWNLGASYMFAMGSRWDGSLSLNVRNIFNAHYSSMYQINAPGALPRYYYPGKSVAVYLNFMVSHKL
jgi:iron complex outermembrane receptor protein